MSEKAEKAAADKKRLQIERLGKSEDLAGIDRDIATVRLKYDGTIAADKTLTNDTMRKASRATMEAADKTLAGMLKQRDDLAHELAMLTIEATYQDDLLRAYTAT